MEIYLKDSENNLRLPVLPSSFERLTTASIVDANIIGLGEVATFNGNGLSKITLSSFFPSKEYSFNEYSNVPNPYDLIAILKNWKNKGVPVRLILTDTDINQQMLITDLNYGIQDGTMDVYYTIDLIEYRPINISKVEESTQATNGGNNTTNRPTENPTNTNNSTQKTHKVVSGDNLWDIAQKAYGKGSDYTKIKEANKDKYPSLANNNVIYSNWELIIP